MLPEGTSTAEVRWEADGASWARSAVDLEASNSAESISGRLHNLGFLGTNEDDQLQKYRMSRRFNVEMSELETREEVKQWHDNAVVPGSPMVASSSSAQQLKSHRIATVCPQVRVDLRRDPKIGWAPHRTYSRPGLGRKPPPIGLWKLNLWKGQHSALIFDDFPGADQLFSGNPLEAVPGPGEGAWKQLPVGGRRVLFLHAYSFTKRMNRYGKDGQADQETSMLSLPTKPVCDVFQVRTDTPTVASLKLLGRSIVLYGDQKKFREMHRDYAMTDQLSAFGMNQLQVVQELAAKVAKDGPIDHLVISAHGIAFKRGLHKGRLAISMGTEPLMYTNANHWFLLNGKIRYIWFLSCSTGFDQGLMRDIVTNLGCAAIGYEQNIPLRSHVGRSCIDFYHGKKPWVFEPDGKGGVSSTIDHRSLFMRARRSFSATNFEHGLDFYMNAAR